MENSTFVLGSEVRGRGEATATDIFIGVCFTVLAFSASLLGLMNLLIIKKMPMFHNAFGWFWASRTVGEIGSNLVHAFYTGPVTILQFKNIPLVLGLGAFSVNYWFGCAACVMHQFIALNRFIAVCLPLMYDKIFKRTNYRLVIVACWTECLIVVIAYYVFPCNLVGYGPTFYDFIFVKCDPNMERDYSVVGTIVNRFCLLVCSGTMVLDLITLCKIIYLQRTWKLHTQSKNFRRDVRFFMQSGVQSITMLIALCLIVIVNNSQSTPIALTATAVNSFILTTLNNSLALILFNPEVRQRFSISFFFTIKTEPGSGHSGSAYQTRRPVSSIMRSMQRESIQVDSRR